MTWEDPVVKEVRDIRDRIAAEHHYDIRTIGRYYQQKQLRATHKFVTRPPRRPDAQKSVVR